MVPCARQYELFVYSFYTQQSASANSKLPIPSTWDISLPIYIAYLAISFIFKIYLFLAALGLCGYMQSFSSCSSGGHSLLRCMGFSMWWLFLLQHKGSVVVVHRLSCSMACGIFLDQGSNPCPLHFQIDSYPLDQQGSPKYVF